jgi:SPP1 gp7 family putative phage head morphogenesis protein
MAHKKTPPKKPVPPEFHASQRLQRSYEQGIREIAGRVFVKKRQDQSFTEWLAELAERSRSKDVQDASELLARRMIFSSQKTNWRTWREAASRSSQAGKLYSMLQAEMQGPTGARVQSLIRENASLISSLPLRSAQTLVDEITKAQQAGARPGTIAKMYQKRFPELLHSRVQLISRTETAKASSALTQARAEALNLDWFEWGTSKDKRTRKSHKNMNGVLCAWQDLPSPEKLVGEADYGVYAAGATFNCRCLVLPLLAFSDVSWPHKVYRNGSIKQMTLTAFKQIAGSEVS